MDQPETPPGVSLLKSWLNKNMKVLMSDGRVLVGIFLCTDRAGNVIIGSCNEYTGDPDKDPECDLVPRLLGLAWYPAIIFPRCGLTSTMIPSELTHHFKRLKTLK